MLFTPLRILIGGLMLIAVILAAMNPGPEKFKEYLQDQIAARAAAEAGAAGLGGAVTDFLADRLGRAVGDLAEDAFTHENYYVWSVYRTDLNGPRAGGEVEFLGIGGTFIPLRTPEVLQDLF